MNVGDDGVLYSRAPKSDEGMRRAMEAAQATIPLFWREIHWEMHRIVPFMDMSVMKVAFSDDPSLISAITSEGADDVEYMWVVDPSFNGVEWTGTVVNTPLALLSVGEGDRVTFTTERVADWTYRMVDQTMGGFTSQHLRSTMNPAERAHFDEMQGMDLGDPAVVQLTPIQPTPYPTKKTGLLKKKSVPVKGPIPPMAQDHAAVFAQEHGMAEAMAARFAEDVKKQPDVVRYTGEDGFSMLHRMALAGATTLVELLLNHGADRELRTPQGLMAVDLASSLGWTRTIRALSV
jgi:uncharacterized protein YegJ (DUF2314 family)